MPREAHLLSRAGRYYLNMRVPKDLLPLFPKSGFVRKSLGTSDYREAVSSVRFEAYKLDAEFAAKRREMQNAKSASTPPPKLSDLSDREVHDIVCRFFVGLEKNSEEWCEDARDFSEEQRADLLDNLRIDESAYVGAGAHYLPDDGSKDLENFLKREGIDCPQDSPAFRKLRPLFRRARVENLGRAIDRVEFKTVREREQYFRGMGAHSPIEPVRTAITLGELLQRHRKMLVDTQRADVTRRTYEIPARVLREVLGEGTRLDAITKDKIEGLFELLKRAPSNVTKRFPGLTIQQAIEVADKRGEEGRLSQKSLENYYTNVSAIFAFAEEKELMKGNPAKDKYLRAAIASGAKKTRKVLFTLEELNRLFRAPLYTGCVDDEAGYATPGSYRTRRGRFWLALLSLFHGLRCNEAAQLYTEDVSEADGIPYFEIREERADGSKCDKRLKTEQSKRRVPIHPELVRIGFLDFVAERRRDTTHPRLFPDLPLGATGYFSNPFSKFFARFRKATLGKECKATFHSLRHHFRDALTEAGVPIPDVEALGGWQVGERSAERLYGSGPSLNRLREQIEKVNYPGLALSHLYAKQAIAPVCRVRKRSQPHSA